MVRIHAVCLVKDEEDVIAQSLLHASRFCHKIYVFDTGSSDNTWQVVQSIDNGIVVPLWQEAVPFYDGLRAKVFNAVRHLFAEGDWCLILDSDEFLVDDPQPAIDWAERNGAQQINTLQYNFYYTDRDWQDHLAGKDSRCQSIAYRRHYYRFTNIEQRLFRVSPKIHWPEDTNEKHPRGFMMPRQNNRLKLKLKVSPQRLANCHYQYRDPDQIQTRLRIRRQARVDNPNNFVHYKSLDTDLDWRRYIIPSEQLHYYQNDGLFKITPQERLALFKQSFGRKDFFRFDFLAL
jgi:glycosyltransferase involved in cell wall biosynthesis